ncbi:MAG: 23S rRNA (adenine(2503)-C(2))-methyltransferase RlmN [Candidatus Methylomirabilis sp.]|nr:23S rRNA (adenine(2503)-C(2))-methyltransferase RlmN [Deltaproteobacteria bacterium]
MESARTIAAPGPLPDLKALSPEELEAALLPLGLKKFRAVQIFEWIHGKDAEDFESFSNLPKAERALLAERFRLGRLETRLHQRSEDGTEKFLFGLADGREIESVLIPDEDRLTLCISSQVGCALGCDFCLTAKMGLVRHLSAGEIVDQVYRVRARLGAERAITNIVFMGMGEPLHNAPNVVKAANLLMHARGANYSARRITISTAGMADRIAALSPDRWVNLTLSLSATTDAVRDRIMPINKKHNIATLMRTLRAVKVPAHRRITIAYVLLDGVNDTDEDARRLVRLLSGLRVKVNLIPFNERPEVPYKRSPRARVEAFQRILADKGLSAFIRESRGRDISAACGQLATENLKDRPLGLPCAD